MSAFLGPPRVYLSGPSDRPAPEPNCQNPDPGAFSSAAGYRGRRPRMDGDAEITSQLLAWRAGEPSAQESLFPLVYEQLRRIAHRQMAGERPEHTLDTTGLVHEAYLKLVDQTRADWTDR